MKLRFRIARLIWSRLPWDIRQVLSMHHIEQDQSLRLIRRDPSEKAWFLIVPFKELTVTPKGEFPIRMQPHDIMTITGSKSTLSVEIVE